MDCAFGTDTAHAVDEYTTVEAIVDNSLVYASLPRAWRDLQGNPR